MTLRVVGAPRGNTQTGIPIVHESHAVGSLNGTDGTLLLSVGDCGYNGTDNGGQQPGTYVNVALNEGILKPHENVGAFRAQTVDSHCGKILRLNPTNGDGLPSNRSLILRSHGHHAVGFG